MSFDGARVATLAKGEDALSDPVDLAVPALARLAVTLHVPAGTGHSTIHGVANQTAYFLPGDATAVPVFPSGDPEASRYFLTGVEVEAVRGAAAIVVLGASITDGVGSTVDGDARWPDALATRLQAKRATASIAVVNAGIAGNRILNDARPPFIGPSSLSRFDRDVLDLPDLVRKVVLSGVSKRRYKKRAREPLGHAPLSASKNPEPGTHIETSRRSRARISCRSPW